jgi:pimeloyl-ACP methyl ester carboxylesterase
LSTNTGPGPILLLHGQPGGARDWDPVVSGIGGRAPTIAFDRPGWDGRSGPHGIAGNARAALAVLDAHGAARAVVVGHSFGAAVAAWLAMQHPERVAGLVLTAPAANVDSLYALDRVLAAPLAGPALSAGALATAGVVLGTGRGARRIARGFGLGERYLASTGAALRRPATWRAFVTEQRAMLRELPVLERRLRHIEAPTVVMIGSADLVVPPSSARRLAGQIPRAQLEVIERAGHLLPLRHAQRVASVALALACR